MSATTVATNPTRERCRYCGDPLPDDPDDPNGRYCSRACYYQYKGDQILSSIKHDHTVCNTCYRQLKTVYRPEQPGRGIQRKPWSDGTYPTRRPASRTAANFIGWQRLTHHTQRAERGHDTHNEYAPLIHNVESGCECGNVDHRDTHGFIQQRVENTDAVADRLFDRLQHLYDKGTIDTEPDRDHFAIGFYAGGPALAAGLACYG